MRAHGYALRRRGGDESLWSQPKAEGRLPYMGRDSWVSAVVGFGVREGLDEKGQGGGAPPPYRFRICESVGCLGRGP